MEAESHSALEAFPLNRAGRLHLPVAFAERRVLLIGLDLIFLSAGLVLALALRPDMDASVALITDNPGWFLLLFALWLPLAYTFDAYDLKVAGHLSHSFMPVLKAGAITTGIYNLVPFLAPALPPNRSSLFGAFLLPVAAALVGRGLYSAVFARPAFQRRVLIIGAGWAGSTLAGALDRHGDSTYRVIGFVDDDPAKQGVTAAVETTGTGEPNGHSFRVLGAREDLGEIILRRNVDTVALAVTDQTDGDLLQALAGCLELGVEIVPMPVLYEQITGRVPIEHVGGHWYVAMPLRHPGTGAFSPILKRAFDVVSAGLGLICLGIAFPFIAVAIYLDSPGPIFYTQERIGKGGRRFRVYKFRSMIPDAERGRAQWAQKNDSRVTRVGKLLRKTHVDEFPQFINILKGEMSAVGPRPERPEFVEELSREIPFYRVRHAVKPGMAGWGLVRQGYGASREDALIKLQYDLFYIKHQSIWLDVVILLKTILDTVTFGGR